MKSNIPIMINGRTKAAIPVNPDDSKEQVTVKAMNIKEVNDIMKAGTAIKTVYVPNRMFNVVVDVE